MNQKEEIGAGSAPETTGAPVFKPENVAPAAASYRQPYREPAPIVSTGRDAIFALLFFVCGYCFVWLIHPARLGFGTTAFTLLFSVLVLSYQKSRGVPLTVEGIFWLVVLLISGANFSLFSNVSLQFLNFLLLMGVAAYWVTVLNSTRLEPRMGQCFPADMVNQLFQVPFRNFGCGVKVVRNTAVKHKRGKTLLAVFCGILVAVPLLGIVFSELIQADAGFASMMQRIIDSIGVEVMRFLLRLLPAFLVGSYLFGLLYGNLQKRHVDSFTADGTEHFLKSLKKLPAAVSVTVLCLLCAVYLLFFGSQAATFFAVLQNRPPEGFTYAEFARRGFFELCRVVFINLAVMLAGFSFTRGDQAKKTLRFINVVLSAETLLLIGIALGKMLLYIQQYGLTQKRVYTSCFMAVLFLIFCMVIFAQFRTFNLVRAVVALCCVSFLSLCYVNADGWIAQYNVDRYLNGSLKDAGVSMMYAAPDASMPAAERLYRLTDNPRLKSELWEFFESQSGQSTPYEEQNLQWIAAQNSEFIRR